MSEDFDAIRTRIEQAWRQDRPVDFDDVARLLHECTRLSRRVDRLHDVIESQARLHRIGAVRRMCWTGEARSIRHSAGATLAELGAAVGVAPSVVSRWEEGRQLPRGDHALAYGAALDLLQTTVDPEPDEHGGSR